jgi:hypothetical protein
MDLTEHTGQVFAIPQVIVSTSRSSMKLLFRNVRIFYSSGFYILYSLTPLKDRLCGLVVRVPGYIKEMYCVSCEVRTEFIYVM